jgi:hypothetical protein
MKMKKKIEILPLSDYYVVAVKDKDTSELLETFTLNESGADMLKLFCQDKDEDEVTAEIATLYETSIEVIKPDVYKFINHLRDKGIIK